MDLFDHLESFLGASGEGWKTNGDGQAMPFQVALFPDVPLADTCALTTLGLSQVALPKPDGHRVRIELILFGHPAWLPRNFPGVLQNIGLEAIESNRALVPGHIIGPRGPLCNGASVTAFLVNPPVFLDDPFHVYEAEGHGSIFMAALIPITSSEVEFFRHHGRERFEDLLLEHDPDLLDFARTAIV